jgi:kynureninase
VERIIIDGSSAAGNFDIKESLNGAINNIYYIGSGWKFLNYGEGTSFMSLPEKCNDRPVFSGWLIHDVPELD